MAATPVGVERVCEGTSIYVNGRPTRVASILIMLILARACLPERRFYRIGCLLFDVPANADEAGVGRLILRESRRVFEDLGDQLGREVQAPTATLTNSTGPVVRSEKRLHADTNLPSQRVRGARRDVSWGIHWQAGTRKFLDVGLSDPSM
jgi:hypothetical protein